MRLYKPNMHKYKRIKKVSQGAFGTVYQFENLSPSSSIPDSTVAIKQVYSSSPNVKRQLEILRDLPAHKNILKVYEILNDNFHTNIVMEFGEFDLGTLIDQIGYPIDEIEVKKVAYQILNALKVLHSKGYIHRDLKPGNVIVDSNGYLKLCDFGSAVKCYNGQEYELEGFTRWYKAPEMLYGCRNYKYEVDIWSLGCILMELATGQPYFDGKSQIEQLSLIARQLGNPTVNNWPSMAKLPDFGKISFKKMEEKTYEQISKERNVSIELATFIKKMIKYEGRSSVEELLKDDYLKNFTQSSQRISMPSEDVRKLSAEIKKSSQTLRRLIRDEIKKC